MPIHGLSSSYTARVKRRKAVAEKIVAKGVLHGSSKFYKLMARYGC